MGLILDDNFKQTYNAYYYKLRSDMVLNSIDKSLTTVKYENLIDALNIVKTAMAINFTYTECRNKIVEKISKKFSGEDIDEFIINLVIKVMMASNAPGIEKFIKPVRNIEREVTAEYFKVPVNKVTDNMVEDVIKASDNFTQKSYSVTDPPVESWDEYFYNVCRQVARNSKCLSRRIGAVLVKDKSIVSTGYNGPPRGVPTCDMRWELDKKFSEKYSDKINGKEVRGECPRRVIGFKSGEGLNICIAQHAERGCILNAARNGICTKGTVMYMSCGIPCTPCLVEIINAGVEEIVVIKLTTYDESAMYLLKQSDLKIRLFDFIK